MQLYCWVPRSFRQGLITRQANQAPKTISLQGTDKPFCWPLGLWSKLECLTGPCGVQPGRQVLCSLAWLEKLDPSWSLKLSSHWPCLVLGLSSWSSQLGEDQGSTHAVQHALLGQRHNKQDCWVTFIKQVCWLKKHCHSAHSQCNQVVPATLTAGKYLLLCWNQGMHLALKPLWPEHTMLLQTWCTQIGCCGHCSADGPCIQAANQDLHS